MLEKLRQSLLNAPIVKFGDYDYFIHPVTDGFPAVDPGLLSEITEAIIGIANLDCDKLITPEAMGIHITTSLSRKTGIPLNIIRRRRYGLEGEVELRLETGYSSEKMYINGLERGERVVFVDDVLSTGGTLRGVLRGLDPMDVEVVDIIIVVNKGKAKDDIEKDFGIPVKCLVEVDIIDSKVVIREG